MRGMILGVLLGLFLAAGVCTLVYARRGAGAPVPDCGGRLRELVIHYLPESDGITLRAYREFLPALSDEVTVYVVVPDPGAFEQLLAALESVPPPSLVPIVVGHEMTCWSRDRWLAVGRTLLSPHAEAGAEIWPARAGDQLMAADLARALPGRYRAVRSDLLFEGGDFVCDEETVFVTPAVADRNPQFDVREVLRGLLHQPVVLLDRAPDHHAGMFMMALGGRRVAVGDPSLADRTEAAAMLEDVDFSAETQADFDDVARACRAAGYEVSRIPCVPSRRSRAWLSPLNVILDGDRVFLPVFRGAPLLNAGATACWERFGFEVVPIDCTGAYPHGGTLRCLVSVLRRD